jgi:hypothetical protein
MNGYTIPAAIIVTLSVIAGVVADTAKPVFTFVGGGAAVGAALWAAWAMRADKPDYGHALGEGTVYGAVVGAGLLLLDQLLGG